MARKTISETEVAKKWSEQIVADGFTCVPNSLIKGLQYLQITPPEFLLLVILDSYRWSHTRLPYPSVDTLSGLLGCSERHVSRLLADLERKQLLRRIFRQNKTNQYDITPLAERLNEYCAIDMSDIDFGLFGHLGDDINVITGRPL